MNLIPTGRLSAPKGGGGAEVTQSVKESVEKYGIHSYRVLRRSTRGTGLQAHHLIEKRFADTLGLKASEIPSVALPKDVHQMVTNKWRSVISYGRGTAQATKTILREAITEVYTDFPDLLRRAVDFLNSLDEATKVIP